VLGGYLSRLGLIFLSSVIALISGWYLLTFACLAAYYVNDWIGE
jgi:hypothetical protein